MAGKPQTVFGRCPIVSPCGKTCTGRSAECRITCEAYKRYEDEKLAWHKEHNQETDPWRSATMERKAENMRRAHRTRRK